MRKLILITIPLIILLSSCTDKQESDLRTNAEVTFNVNGQDFESTTFTTATPSGETITHQPKAKDYYFSQTHFFEISAPFLTADGDTEFIEIKIVLPDNAQIESVTYDNLDERISMFSFRNTDIELSLNFCGALEFYSCRDAVITFEETGQSFTGTFSGTLTFAVAGQDPCSPNQMPISGRFNNISF